ncbi:MAG: amino acid ABC transporter permease [Acidimicrobiia bacterium]|nr:amino acid ABC transporter permease [Acidimicrobiia bacterium]
MTTTAPQTPRLSPLAWARRHLFRTWGDTVITVVAAVVVGYVVYRFANFVFVTGRWEIIRVNLSLFIVGLYDRDELWRPALALIVTGGLGGLVAGVVRRRQLFAGSADPDRPLGERLVDLAGRLWPAVLAVLLLLMMATTITPWLVVAATIAAAIVFRLIGERLPRRALAPVVVVVIATMFFMVWLLAQGVGWDEWGGLMLNVFLAAVSITLCFPLGVLLALGRRSKLPLIRAISTAYIELFRGVPLIVLLFMVNNTLGFFMPGDYDPSSVLRAIVVFTLFTAAYVAEIVRGGLQSVPRGQVEAGQALGMSPVRITFLIVLPQALRNVIPALVGQFISLFKDTTLAGAAMGFLELLQTAEAVTRFPDFSGQGLIAETLVFVTFIFWVGSYTMSRESQRLEHKLGVGTR